MDSDHMSASMRDMPAAISRWQAACTRCPGSRRRRTAYHMATNPLTPMAARFTPDAQAGAVSVWMDAGSAEAPP